MQSGIEHQLRPETVPDPAIGELLADLPTLEMSSEEPLVAYPPPQLLRGISQRLAATKGMDADAVRDLFPVLAEVRRRQAMREPVAERELGRDGRSRANRMAMAMGSPCRIVVELS